MTLTQVWGALIIFLGCPILGGLPLIQWVTYIGTGQRLNQLGTGNVSVSAAFYHGGRFIGILAVLSEAAKGIVAVLLARQFFPTEPMWEIIALIALVMGRYWFGRGAGATNVVWGYAVHDPVAAGLTFLIGSISFTILRERKLAKFGVLVLFPVITALLHPDDAARVIAAMALAGLMAWIYTKLPDDLDLESQSAQKGSRAMLRFFQGDRAFQSLDQPLKPEKVGAKAATLAELKRLGYPVPSGWVLVPGDDPERLLTQVDPSPKHPVIVRSSAIGEDAAATSAAGQYESIAGVTSREALLPAVSRCFASYHRPAAVQYRRSLALPDAFMAVIVQHQVRGAVSGVAFSRDPIQRQGEAVVIEALPGGAAQVVSGRATPQTYRVEISAAVTQTASTWRLPDDVTLPVEGSGEISPRLMQQVAYLARHLENHYHGIPQDIEWSFDGQNLWLLQARPVTTLQPLWTRKIASEVIPGLVPPLTWSINRPLTCGVWGDLFTIVLGNRAQGLDFTETATLHFSRAYFNATLLGQIFRRMGLPPESLEFLTRGAKFSKPPLQSTLRNLPGLLRLAQREWVLEKDFQRDDRQYFSPALMTLAQQPAPTLAPAELLTRIETILSQLKRATYYSILAPLSAALRKALAKVDETAIDNRATPEIGAVRSLQALATSARQTLEAIQPASFPSDATELWAILTANTAGQSILAQLEQIIDQYGYLSEVGTDIAVPTWKEHPQPVQDLFAQFCLNPPESQPAVQELQQHQSLQRRFDLKGRVTEVYSRLLAELRWSFVALEHQWLEAGVLRKPGDIFFLTFNEIQQVVNGEQAQLPISIADLVQARQGQLERDRQQNSVSFLVYGNDPPEPVFQFNGAATAQRLQGIGASPGQVEGTILVVTSLTNLPKIEPNTIIVVPYTDSGWVPLLAQARGLVAEVGGQLSHGAIIAREYRIPAVMDIHNATQIFHNGQRVRLDGQQGIVEIL